MNFTRGRLQICGNILLLVLCLLAPASRPAAQEKVGAGAPRVGQMAPEFTLPDANGKLVKLSELLVSPSARGAEANGKTRWLVLIFYRGYW